MAYTSFMVDEFTPANVLQRMSEIDDEIVEEQAKDAKERSRERELKLLNMKLMEGMKLSTGYYRPR